MPEKTGCVDGRLLHIPSPVWSDQVIYAIITDRFNDGDPARNDQGAGEYDPAKPTHYSGGDIRGIIEKVDYVKALGATAVWTTPFTAAKWIDEGIPEEPTLYTGYHGYWPVNFMEVDPHLGTLDDVKDLSHALHTRGMYLIQDAIVNHVAHFYHYAGEYNPQDVTENFVLLKNQLPPHAPRLRPPFDQNNVLDPAQAQAAIYHWTPQIEDYSDPVQRLTYQVKFVNDLNTSNVKVRKALKAAYAYWIREIGVDGQRIDTAKHVEHDFWHDFFYAEDGMIEAARQTGRNQFLSFGESWEFSQPFEDSGERTLREYIVGAREGKPEFTTMLGFPLFSKIDRVLNSDLPSEHLAYRLGAHMRIYPDPYIVPNFLESHDVPRFLKKGGEAATIQAFAIMMTVPGIPIILQGAEQGFVESRKAMFRGGYLSGDRDWFDRQSGFFKTIQRLIKVRRESHQIFTRGTLELLNNNPLGPGVFAYKRSYNGRSGFVIMNTARDHTTLLNQMPTGLPEGSVLTTLFSERIEIKGGVRVGHAGSVTLELPPRSVLILSQGDKQAPVRSKNLRPPEGQAITVDQLLQDTMLRENASLLSGRFSHPNAELKLVIDGNLDAARSVVTDGDGYWETVLPITSLDTQPHSVEFYSGQLGLASPRQIFDVDLKAEIDVRVQDALNDDHGPGGNYLPPRHETIGKNMDIRSARVKANEDGLMLILDMNEVTNTWYQVNGFEAVAFEIFFDLPGREGVTALPNMNASAPRGFRWDRGHSFYGHGNLFYSREGAGRRERGKTLQYEPVFNIDTVNNEISLYYKSSELGISDWRGTRIYITTWGRDHEGELRAIGKEADIWLFGGGKPSDPKIMDDLMVTIH